MTKVDQFESAFRAASKAVFDYAPVTVRTVLVVTDLPEYDATQFAEQVQRFLPALSDEVNWHVIASDAFTTIRDLLDLVESHQPDLICTYRHLHTEGWRWGFTLGDHVEVLTQATTTPVMLLPHPRLGEPSARALAETRSVMAVTDHLTGDDRLVNYAAALTQPGGTLYLAHIEDDAVLDRYVDAISKIDSIDTDHAREMLHHRLLKEPRDFMDSCRDGLAKAGMDLTVKPVIAMGHHLREYQDLVAAHAIDLLVINTKDDDQLAMHGLAYPLAVELNTTPMLLL